jgi:hypothetical protein
MATLAAARDRYAQRQRLSNDVAAEGARSWALVDPRDITGSWRSLAPRVGVALAGAQLAAARGSDGYVAAALDQQGVSADADGQVVPRSLAGIASDGRSLATLLEHPRITALTAISRGVAPVRALAVGYAELDMILRTQVADAGRVSDGVAITARPDVGWVRQIQGKTCGRCAILAGKWFRSNEGFLRHPRCDCVHIPAQEDVAGDLTTDPRRYFDSLSAEDQSRLFGKDNAQAIRDGADMGRVVNATGRGGMYTTAGGRKATTELGRGRTRLVPEEIYRIAPDRPTALALLRMHGYIR